jgi:hypothetical protein
MAQPYGAGLARITRSTRKPTAAVAISPAITAEATLLIDRKYAKSNPRLVESAWIGPPPKETVSSLCPQLIIALGRSRALASRTAKDSVSMLHWPYAFAHSATFITRIIPSVVTWLRPCRYGVSRIILVPLRNENFRLGTRAFSQNENYSRMPKAFGSHISPQKCVIWSKHFATLLEIIFLGRLREDKHIGMGAVSKYNAAHKSFHHWRVSSFLRRHTYWRWRLVRWCGRHNLMKNGTTLSTMQAAAARINNLPVALLNGGGILESAVGNQGCM